MVADKPRQLRRQTDPDWSEIAFIAGIAHDLKTPLATIATSAELLEQEQEPILHSRLVQIIQRQTRRMQTMIQDLSDYISLEAGRVLLRPEAIDLAALVRDYCNEFRETATRHRIDYLLPAGPVIIEADPAKVRRILENLLRNAVKYTPEGSHVVAILRPNAANERTVQIAVEDEGAGVAETDRKAIFDPFVRLDAGDIVAGQGLGLHIVRQLAEAHGGSVWVESSSAGGARFCVELPVVNARSSELRRHA